jgi:hypothetical protein
MPNNNKTPPQARDGGKSDSTSTLIIRPQANAGKTNARYTRTGAAEPRAISILSPERPSAPRGR